MRARGNIEDKAPLRKRRRRHRNCDQRKRAAWIDILAGGSRSAPRRIFHNLLNQVCDLLAGQRRFVFYVPRARNWTIGEQRETTPACASAMASARNSLRFPKFGVLPIPVPPDDRGNGPLPLGKTR